MRLSFLTVIVLFVSASAFCSEKANLAVQDVVRSIGPQQPAAPGAVAASSDGNETGVKIRVKDGHLAAKDCSVGWYETDVTCAGTVKFKGFSDCDKPCRAEKLTTDCGTVKQTTVFFQSGKHVEIRKNSLGVVTIDYDSK